MGKTQRRSRRSINAVILLVLALLMQSIQFIPSISVTPWAPSVAGAHKIRDFEPGHGLHDGLFNGSELAIIDLYRGVDHAGPGIWKPDRGGCGLYLAARDRCNRIKEKSAVAGA